MFAVWSSVCQRIGASVCRLGHATTSCCSPVLKQSSPVSTLSLPPPRSDQNVTLKTFGPSVSCLCPSMLPGALPMRHASFYKECLKKHMTGIYGKVRKKKGSILDGRPQMRGVVLRTLIKKPKKPNSANRKCVRLRLTNGKEATAYVPGEGHSLQEHNIVLVQNGRLQDTPGVKLTCIRGKYDLPHVKKKTQ